MVSLDIYYAVLSIYKKVEQNSIRPPLVIIVIDTLKVDSLKRKVVRSLGINYIEAYLTLYASQESSPHLKGDAIDEKTARFNRLPLKFNVCSGYATLSAQSWYVC